MGIIIKDEGHAYGCDRCPKEGVGVSRSLKKLGWIIPQLDSKNKDSAGNYLYEGEILCPDCSGYASKVACFGCGVKVPKSEAAAWLKMDHEGEEVSLCTLCIPKKDSHFKQLKDVADGAAQDEKVANEAKKENESKMSPEDKKKLIDEKRQILIDQGKSKKAFSLECVQCALKIQTSAYIPEDALDFFKAEGWEREPEKLCPACIKAKSINPPEAAPETMAEEKVEEVKEEPQMKKCKISCVKCSGEENTYADNESSAEDAFIAKGWDVESKTCPSCLAIKATSAAAQEEAIQKEAAEGANTPVSEGKVKSTFSCVACKKPYNFDFVSMQEFETEMHKKGYEITGKDDLGDEFVIEGKCFNCASKGVGEYELQPEQIEGIGAEKKPKAYPDVVTMKKPLTKREKKVFSDAELLELSDELSSRVLEIAELEKKKKSVMADLKAEMDRVHSEVAELSRKVNDKHEYIEVSYIVKLNYKKGKRELYYSSNKEFAREINFEADDYQRTMM